MKMCTAFALAPTDPALRSEGPDDRFEEFDKPDTVEAIAEVIRGEGHEVVLLGGVTVIVKGSDRRRARGSRRRSVCRARTE